jgi:hypothetical protein
MAVKFSNNAKTTISGSLNTSATSVTVADASNFPTLGAGDYTYATLAEVSTPANLEIVKVTAINSNTLTVTRAQQGTSARSFSASDLCELRVTAGLMEEAISDSSGGISYTRVTANHTMVSGTGVIADTTGGAFTVTLPASPSVGDEVAIADGGSWGVAYLTVARNGSTIEGLAEDLTLDVSGLKVGLVYDGTTWQVYPSAGIFAGASGGAFYKNNQVVSSDVTILSTENAMTTGPVSVNSGVNMTIQSGARVVVL